jgi:hypothetical protein
LTGTVATLDARLAELLLETASLEALLDTALVETCPAIV